MRQKQAEMLYFELWCCVKVSQEEKWEEMAKCLFPRGDLEEESGVRGTNESEGIER